MANLVTPVNHLTPIEERIIDFKGLNRRPVVEDGEMSDMLNLTSDNYPLLTPRKPRGVYTMPEGAKRPIQLLTRLGKLAMIAVDDDNNVSFFFDGRKINEVTRLTTSSRAVIINTKVCFFPEKMCIDVYQNEQGIQIENYRSLEASVHVSSANVSASRDSTKITMPSADHGFKADDAITIQGTIEYNGTTQNVDISCIVESIENGTTLVLPQGTLLQVTAAGTTTATLTADIERTMKDFDHIIEWNNRLWGACNRDNTIYACKLGDPTNWQYFQGTSMDSYYAQQGTDENFTGVAEYSGHIIFFKPNSMCRIYGTAPSNYQVTNTKCYGVEDGSRLSVVTVNDTVFYKSAIGIMAYDGGTPYCISNKFNSEFKYVVAGTEGQKYYASCLVSKNGTAESELMVLDIDKGMWHKEDSTRFSSCCTVDNRLYYSHSQGEILYCSDDIYCSEYLMCGTEDVEGSVQIANPKRSTEAYEDIDWRAVFGPFDEYLEEHKIYSKLALRLKANGPCTAKVYISMDEGEWELVEDYSEVSTKGDFIPIIPRRCDRYSVKVEGTGNCEMKSLTRRVRRGSFGRL